MDGGTFGRELIAFARGLAALIEDVKALMGSEIYKQRLVRVLRHPRNKEALGDFLVLDSFCRNLVDLEGEEAVDALWEIRKQTFNEAYDAVVHSPTFAPEKKWSLERFKYRLLHITFSKGSPEEVLEQIGAGLELG